MFISRWRRWFQYPIVFCLPASPCLTLPSLPSQIAGHVIAAVSQDAFISRVEGGWEVSPFLRHQDDGKECASVWIFSLLMTLLHYKAKNNYIKSTFIAHSAPARRYYDYLETIFCILLHRCLSYIRLFCRVLHLVRSPGMFE